MIEAGALVVIGRTDAATGAVAYWGSAPALDNPGDRVRLLGPAGVIDETPDYGLAASGTAIQLDPSAFDGDRNDDPAVGCAAPADAGSDRGTPGAVNDPC